MNELCEKANVEWSFENIAYGFYFTFYRKNVTPNVTPDIVYSDLNENEIIVLKAIKDNPKILRHELVKIVKKTERTVQRYLTSLIKKGYLTRIGSNQYGYWEILK